MTAAKKNTGIALTAAAAGFLAFAAPSDAFAVGACGTAHKGSKAQSASKGGGSITQIQEAPEKKGGKAKKI